MRILYLLPCLLSASLATAQFTYFVDAVNGANTNPGTSRALAFQSLTFAVSILADDDRLVVLPGTYSPTRSGEAFPIQLGLVRSQKRVRIVAEQGPAVTILDGEGGAVSAGTPLLRFRLDADGSSLSGLQFTNTGNADYWSMAIRLGSTSGGVFAAQNIDISGCEFRNVHRAIVVFGTEPANPTQTTGCTIHDNLVENATGRAFAMWGPGANALYNNTIVNCSVEGIWIDSLPTQASSGALIANNIVVNGLTDGIGMGPNGGTAVVESNNSFGNAGLAYNGFTPSASNLSVDPLFVGAGDYRLTAGSPMVQTGTLAGLPIVRVDLDSFSRAHDSDGSNLAEVDRGAYQRTVHGMTVTGPWAPGQTASFNFTGPAGGGVILFATRPGAFLLQPFGVFAIDFTSLAVSAPIGAVPSTFQLPVPNQANLLGVRFILQGAYVGPVGPIHLLNAVQRTF